MCTAVDTEDEDPVVRNVIEFISLLFKQSAVTPLTPHPSLIPSPLSS